MATAVADVTVPQHMQALARAQQVRLRRCEVKREIASLPIAEGSALVREILRGEPEGALAGMSLGDLFGSIARVGETRSGELLGEISTLSGGRIGPEKALRSLTGRQRKVIAEVLRYRLEPR